MTKVSDYIIKRIADLGVKHVFFLPGGGSMYLNDSLGSSSDVEGICMLHEQAASIAAEAYARITENYGVCMVTSGPGATNAITGLTAAWLDSTPVIFISGQAKRADLIGSQKIRQFGIQEVDIISIVKPITKYAVQILDPDEIYYEFEKAISFARNGRPGPVWIDVPMDVQTSIVDEDQVRKYNSSDLITPACVSDDIINVIEHLNRSKRPVILLGNGVRLSGAAKLVQPLVEVLKIPVLTTWNGIDLIEDTNPYYFGRPGAVGIRYSNFIQQKADFVLSIGTRLNLLSTGFDYDSFLKNAYHVMVDIDKYEMKKKSVNPSMAVESDAKFFIEEILKNSIKINTNKESITKWLAVCNELKNKYGIMTEKNDPPDDGISIYKFVDCLTDKMDGNDIFQFTSSGTAVDISMQSFKVKKGQRTFLTKGLASMGFDVPASIGSCLASGGKRTVCVTGDGGFVMNIQELETLRRLSLPVKIFVIDNDGYSMIYASQKNNFDGRLTGCTPSSGLTLPSVIKMANAFGIPSYSIEIYDPMDNIISDVLAHPGPVICRVKGSIAQPILPRQTNYRKPDGQMASLPLHEMSPPLDADEFNYVMKL